MAYYDPDFIKLHEEKIHVLGDPDFREVLSNIIYMLPKNILDDICLNCSFFMLNEKLHAAYFIPNISIAKKSIIALSGGFYSMERDKQTRLIFHEIAHYVLGHIDEGQPKEELLKDEDEANALRDKWLKDWNKHLWKEVLASDKS